MKSNKFLRISVLILTVALCAGVVFAMNISAETEPKTPKIVSQNVEYNEKFSIMYAVDASTAVAPVTLNLYDKLPSEGVSPIRAYQVSDITLTTDKIAPPVDSYVFFTDGIAATAMTKEFYVQVVGADGGISEVKRYSLGEYLYEKLASNPKEDRKAFYEATLLFGESAQKVIAKETDTTKYVTNYRYVTVKDGTINGFKSGIYPVGAVLTPVKEGATKWSVLTYYKEGDPVLTKTTDTFTISADSVKTELSSGDLVIYKTPAQGLYNYEDKEAGSITLSGFTVSGTPTSMGYVDSKGEHGIVGDVTFTSGNYICKYSPSTKIVSAADATALEWSFDIKVDTKGAGENTTADPDVVLNIRGYIWSTSSNRLSYSNLHRTGLYFDSEGNCKIGCQSSGKNSATAVEGVKEGEWFHVRVVYYLGCDNAYYYINGSDTPTYIDKSADSKLSNAKLDANGTIPASIKDIQRVDFVSNKDCQIGVNIQFDNFFYGFIKEDKPADPVEQ